MTFAPTHFSVRVITPAVCNSRAFNYSDGMSNTSPHSVTSAAREQLPSTIGRPRPHQADDAVPTLAHDRAHVGRFDDGMSTYPDRNRAHVGRFDDGMSTYPDRNRAHVGRFDDGMSTYPDRDRAHVGRFDDGMSTALDHGQPPIRSIDDGTAEDALAA
jgi:hypothetical protein